jgi:hypothetical protein
MHELCLKHLLFDVSLRILLEDLHFILLFHNGSVLLNCVSDEFDPFVESVDCAFQNFDGAPADRLEAVVELVVLFAYLPHQALSREEGTSKSDLSISCFYSYSAIRVALNYFIVYALWAS